MSTMKTKAKTREPKATPPIPTGMEAFLSRADIAAALRVSVRQLDMMIGEGDYPKPDTYFGKLPRWSRETHDRWARQRRGVEG
jgi:Uma2 family endonuclease